MVREIRHAIYTIIRQAFRDGDKALATEFRQLQNSFHIFKYPIEFTERLMAIIQERPSNIDLVLEDIFNRGKADTLEEYIFDVKIYLAENGMTLQEWYRCIYSIEFVSSELMLDLSYLLTIIFDEEDVEDNIIQDIEDFNNMYQLIAPTKDEQVEKLTKIGIQLCPSCFSPQENHQICDYCINQEN